MLASVPIGLAAACAWPHLAGARTGEEQKPSPFGGLAPFVHGAGPSAADTYRRIARLEAAKAGLPFDLADAVMRIESGYDPTRIGGVGEIGLMQVRPQTAAMLGFKGKPGDLAAPETNIHYGIAYLARAWQLANGDVCRALMKYRAGHGEEVMTAKSVTYCSRAKAHLEARGSALAKNLVVPAGAVSVAAGGPPGRSLRGLRGAAFWAAQESRIRRLTEAVHAKWQHLAAR